MGLRAWWQRQTGIVDEMRAEEHARVIPQLQPILDAEHARGNDPIGGWRQLPPSRDAGTFAYQRTLRYPLDEEALRAEFEFDPAEIMVSHNAAFTADGTAELRGGSPPTQRQRLAEWQQARERWWAAWRAGAQRPRSLHVPIADRMRVVTALEPVIEAERSRGNEPVDFWHRADDGWYERHLMFPLDVDALRAEFVFDDEVWLQDNRVGSAGDEAVVHGGTRPLSRYEQAARERWWERWRSAPQPPRPLSECAT